MNFSQFLLIMRARSKIILLVFGVTVITALMVSLVVPKTYKATATLVVNYKGIDPVSGSSLPAQLMPGYMATQVGIVRSMQVALRVVDNLRLAEDAQMREKFERSSGGEGNYREWRAEQLLKQLDVAPDRESSVINIDFKDSDARFAASVANAFADAYLHTSIRLKVEPSKKAAGYFNDQIRQLRDKFEDAQKKVTRYQEENGIMSPDSRADVESTRLNELSNQLVGVQGMLMDAASRRAQAASGAAEAPDVVANPLIQSLRLQLAQAEAHLKGISEHFTEAHPQYQAAAAEVEKLQAELDRQIKTASNGIANNERIFRRREAQLSEALDAQKAKVRDLNRKRDELKVLINEMDGAQRSYEAAMQRFSQNNFEGQSNQTDVAVLDAAVPPLLAASPKVKVNVMLGGVVGILLGVGFAFLAEMLDRRVRSIDDLVKGLRVPVLGVLISDMQPKRSRLGIAPLLLPYRTMTNKESI